MNIKPLKSLFKGTASLDKRKARSGYIFVLPFVLAIVLLYIPIILDSIWFSFTDESGASVGFDNYVLAFETTKFTDALLAGLQELLFQVPAIIIFSLFVAVVLNNKMLGRAVFRAIFFVPVIISTGLMESINASDSVTQDSLEGIESGMAEKEESADQLISTLDVEMLFRSMKIGGQLVDVIVELVNNIYNIINYSGVQMLIFLAGLQSISPAIYEACRIDGATGWETFWKVTFPMISPMILVNSVYTIIDAFTRKTGATMSYIWGAEGPIKSQATAMSWIYFLIVVVILAVITGIISSFIFYQRRD